MSDADAPDPIGPGSAGTAPSSARRRFLGRGVMLTIAAVSLYLIGPSVLEVFSSWDQLGDLEPMWLGLVALAQLAAFVSLWALQRVALKTRSWLPVVTSQLAGNAAARIVPGGAATGTAVQFHLLRTAGINPAKATSGLTAAGLLQLATTFTLPLIALPGVLVGAPAPPSLASAAWLGSILFAVLFALVAAALTYDRPLRLAGQFIEVVRAHTPGLRPSDNSLSLLFLTERDAVIRRLDGRWGRAALFAVARAGFDYLSLMIAITAFGAEARPSFVLLAYASSTLLSLIPLTPGGLGFVEAGLTGALTVAGVPPSDAVAATLLYRLFSFWLPIPIGMLAGVVHRFRSG
ncbi:MAG: flippase-like domain-containing protein [Actinomycetia bacterium]|nr:flippase-like domain-containing protein [Actinomycetes bacterium]